MAYSNVMQHIQLVYQPAEQQANISMCFYMEMVDIADFQYFLDGSRNKAR